MRKISFIFATLMAVAITSVFAVAGGHGDGHSHDDHEHDKKEMKHEHGKKHNMGAIKINAPWIRSTAPGAPSSAAYFTLTNTSSIPVSIIAASSDIADRVEIHEHTMTDGVMKMQEVSGVTIPSKKRVEFKPGGYHVMFMGLKDAVKEGDKVTITLSFDNDTEQTINAIAQKKAKEHSHDHDHKHGDHEHHHH